MKKSKIIIAALALMSVALSFTGCADFGKDDFFGTWKVDYTVTNENLLSPTELNNKGEKLSDGVNRSDKLNNKVTLYAYFDGTTENLGAKSKGRFYQYKIINNASNGSFWYGEYELQDNQNYTNGTLILNYFNGGAVTDTRANELANAWITEKKLKDEMKTYSGLAGDPSEETFKFVLDSGSLFNGYSSLVTTAYKNCSWEVKSRNFELQGKTNNLKEYIGSRSVNRSVLPAYNNTNEK